MPAETNLEPSKIAPLNKLLIEACEDSACTKPMADSYIHAMINPASYTHTFGVIYESSKEAQKSADTLIFKGIDSSNFELTLIVDGTGVVPMPDGLKTVEQYVTKLKTIIFDYQGAEHRPNFLKLSWGKVVFTGVCSRLTVNYKLFNSDGSPIRAEVKISFGQTKDFKTKTKEAKKESPDLTHILTVGAGDTLPIMAYRIYGDASYYMEVARANGLNSIHAIRPGDQLYFPPLKKA
jgi:LysM repeat protein